MAGTPTRPVNTQGPHGAWAQDASGDQKDEGSPTTLLHLDQQQDGNHVPGCSEALAALRKGADHTGSYYDLRSDCLGPKLSPDTAGWVTHAKLLNLSVPQFTAPSKSVLASSVEPLMISKRSLEGIGNWYWVST